MIFRRSVPLQLAVISVLWPWPASAQLPIGPHLQDLRTDSVIVIWRQSDEAPSAVTVDGRRFEAPGPGFVREVLLNGLEPRTHYTYEVEADGITESGSFTTAPAQPLTRFRFVVFGDNRTNFEIHQDVVNAAAAEPEIDFMVNTGDMVGTGDDEGDWHAFFDAESGFLRHIPWFPTLGNHEEVDGEVPFQYEAYVAPPTGSSGTEAYYSFRFANTGFVVLDGHANVAPRLFGLWHDFDATQKQWLESVLAEFSADPTIQHIFVVNHEPPYSSKEGRNGNHALRLLLPLFADHNVDAILNGHDHYMERGHGPHDIPYFIMGGGGASLYENESEGNPGYRIPTALPWLDDGHTVSWAQSCHGYMVVTVENGQVDVEIKNTSGAVIDTASWNTGDRDPPLPPDGGVDAGPDADVAHPDADRDDPSPSDGGESDADERSDGPRQPDAHPDARPDTPLRDADPDQPTPDGDPDTDRAPQPPPSGNGCDCLAAPAQPLMLRALLF